MLQNGKKHQFVPWRTMELWGRKIKIWSFISTFGKMGGCICNLLACLVSQSCPTLCDPLDYSLPGSSVHGIFSGKNTGVGCHFLLGGIVPAQGLNLHLLCLLHCRQIFYLVTMTLDLPVTLNFPARILEWVAIYSSRGSSWHRNWTCISCISCIGRQILYCWATWEFLYIYYSSIKRNENFAVCKNMDGLRGYYAKWN